MFHAFIHTLITACISDAPKAWWAFQSSFDFRSKRRERETEQHHSRLCPRQIQWLATLISNAFPFIFDSFISDLFELIACLIRLSQLLLCEFSQGRKPTAWLDWIAQYRIYCTFFFQYYIFVSGGSSKLLNCATKKCNVFFSFSFKTSPSAMKTFVLPFYIQIITFVLTASGCYPDITCALIIKCCTQCAQCTVWMTAVWNVFQQWILVKCLASWLRPHPPLSRLALTWWGV